IDPGQARRGQAREEEGVARRLEERVRGQDAEDGDEGGRGPRTLLGADAREASKHASRHYNRIGSGLLRRGRRLQAQEERGGLARTDGHGASPEARVLEDLDVNDPGGPAELVGAVRIRRTRDPARPLESPPTAAPD